VRKIIPNARCELWHTNTRLLARFSYVWWISELLQPTVGVEPQ